MGKRRWKRNGDPPELAPQEQVDRVLRLISQVTRTQAKEADKRPSVTARAVERNKRRVILRSKWTRIKLSELASKEPQETILNLISQNDRQIEQELRCKKPHDNSEPNNKI